MTIHPKGGARTVRRGLLAGLAAVPAVLLLSGCFGMPIPELTRVDTPEATEPSSPDESPMQSTDDFVPVVSADEVLYIEVPSDWSDVDDDESFTSESDGASWSALEAAEDLTAFEAGQAPGVKIAASEDTSISLGEGLDSVSSGIGSNCEATDTDVDFDDGVYTGQYSSWTCGDFDVLALAALDEDSTHMVLMEAVVPYGDDDTLQQLESTYVADFG